MLKFLFGVIVGAIGYWVYSFWKGEDTSWDTSFTPTGTGSSSVGGYTSEPVGSSTTSEPSATGSTING